MHWLQFGSDSVECKNVGGGLYSTTNCTATHPISIPIKERSDWFLMEVTFVAPHLLHELPPSLQPTADMFN
jgi:hypothetical protein